MSPKPRTAAVCSRLSPGRGCLPLQAGASRLFGQVRISSQRSDMKVSSACGGKTRRHCTGLNVSTRVAIDRQSDSAPHDSRLRRPCTQAAEPASAPRAGAPRAGRAAGWQLQGHSGLRPEPLLQIGLISLAGRLWLEISLTRQRKADGWSFATPAANSTGILPDPQGGKRDITVKNEGNTL